MKKILFILLIGFLLFSCNKKFSLKNNHNFIILDSLKIEIEASYICCNDSLIFMSKKYDSEIVCYDYHGNKLFYFGSKGEGPCEFVNGASNITIWKNFLVAVDIPKFRIELFDLTGKYINDINYTKEMISPIYNIVPFNNKLLIEGLSFSFDDGTKLTRKTIYIDKNFKINEISNFVIKKIPSLQSIFKNYNPFNMENNYFLLDNNMITKKNSDDTLRIYSLQDSFDIYLNFIKPKKIDKEIIDFYSDDSSMNGKFDIKYSFPKYLPKIKAVYKLNNNLLLLSQYQFIKNSIDKLQNQMYLYDYNTHEVSIIEIPKVIPINKIKLIFKDYVFVLYENSITVFKCIIK